MRVLDEARRVDDRDKEVLNAYRAGRASIRSAEVIVPAGLARFSPDPELLAAFKEGRDDAAAFNN